MNGNILVIPFVIAMVGMVVMLLSCVVKLEVVKAGKADKPCRRTRYVFSGRSKMVCVGGRREDVSDCRKMVVCGNSMKKYDIVDNNCIYVKLYKDEEKSGIDTHPVLVLNIIDNPDKDDAQYKLRKFLCYYHGEKFEEVYRSNAGRLRGITEEEFVAMCSSKYANMSDSGKGDLILSETFDEDNGSVQYSFHPVSAIYGKVVYAQ